MKPITVLIADDHALVRAGISSLLATLPNVQVAGEAGNGRDALKLVERLRPNVVLMDVAMSGLNGLESLSRIAKKYPRVRVIMLSMYANEEYVIQALEAGASGYLVKDAAPAELEVAVRAVALGETHLSPKVSKQVVQDYLRRVSESAEENPVKPKTGASALLTARQREILQLVAEGRSTKEIASELNLAVKTVEAHRAQIMGRLGIHDIAGIVRYAIRTGLVSADR